MICSFAGTPFGKSDARRASRLTRPSRAECARVLVRGRDAPLRRAAAPATPCARLRCAPSDAARLNDLPHSGQTNVPLVLPAEVVRFVALFRFEADVRVARFSDVDVLVDAVFRALAFVRGLATVSAPYSRETATDVARANNASGWMRSLRCGCEREENVSLPV